MGISSKRGTAAPVKITNLERYQIIKVACSHHSAALSSNGELFIWGTGVFGEYLTPLRYG